VLTEIEIVVAHSFSGIIILIRIPLNHLTIMDNVIEERISINPEICHGKPCIASTRIPVGLVLELLESGASFREILSMYPHLTKKDIYACIRYARIVIDNVGSDRSHAKIESSP
jgi:uncharacterized protein (DUF433 family)